MDTWFDNYELREKYKKYGYKEINYVERADIDNSDVLE